MAEHAQRLISGNPSLGQRITVCFVLLGSVPHLATLDPQILNYCYNSYAIGYQRQGRGS